MKKFHRFALSLTTAGLLALTALVSMAHGAERGGAKATLGNANISIDYGRPSLKGRDPVKMLQPGQVWRIGADAPTTIESDVDLDFGGTKVLKGKHILLARLVEAGTWTLVASKKPYNQYEPGAKIAETPLELREENDSIELVTIRLSNKDGKGVIEIAWGKMRLTGSFAPAK
jgi:hypothetical protein